MPQNDPLIFFARLALPTVLAFVEASPCPIHLLVVLHFSPSLSACFINTMSCWFFLSFSPGFCLKVDNVSATSACGCYLPCISNFSVSLCICHKQNMAGFKFSNQIWKSVLSEFNLFTFWGFDLNILSCFWLFSIYFLAFCFTDFLYSFYFFWKVHILFLFLLLHFLFFFRIFLLWKNLKIV